MCDDPPVNRSRPILLVAAALSLLAVFSLANRREPEPVPITPSYAASPRIEQLGWEERLPEGESGLVFRVHSLEVLQHGWCAEVALENRTAVPWTVASGPPDREFGLMVFPDDDLEALERRNRSGSLPPIRYARVLSPAPPPTLKPGDVWAGVLEAPGALPAGRWVRVVFGRLTVSLERPDDVPEFMWEEMKREELPKGMPDHVVWITDHAYHLAG